MTATALRLRATAGSEWIKFRSVRSVPAVLSATALVMVVGGVLLATPCSRPPSPGGCWSG